MNLISQPIPLARQSRGLTRSVMYQIFLRSFTVEGTLAAATTRLPDVAKLGIDIVYLCPICRQDDDQRREFWSERQRRSAFGNPRNPYRIADFFAIDPEYGSDQDLRSFVATAHQLGMKVLLDIVFFHCGPTAVFLRDHPNFIKRSADGGMAKGFWAFPLLNFDDPGLREHLWMNLEYWIRVFDVDGYRYDVSDMVPLDFWVTARRRIGQIKPEAIILGEGQRKEDQIAAMDINYSFTWTTAIHALCNDGASAATLPALWHAMRDERPAGYRFIRYIENHDIANDNAQGDPRQNLKQDRRIDKAWGHAAVDAFLCLCFCLDGVPFLYNGQEVADIAQHSIYGNVPIDWARGASIEGEHRLALCQRLCAIRHEEAALADGELTWLEHAHPETLIAFTRILGDRRLVVLINAKARAVAGLIAIPGQAIRSTETVLSAGADVAVESGSPQLRFTLEPFGYALLACG